MRKDLIVVPLLAMVGIKPAPYPYLDYVQIFEVLDGVCEGHC